MQEVISVDSAIDLSNRPTYNIDWEITYFCNLNCSYCGSHDNSTKHPTVEECKKGIDFAFAYADLVVSQRKSYERSVSLNVLGGETLIHPNIVEILEYMFNLYQSTYKARWPLTTNITTNGVVGKNVLEKTIPLIDNWVVSYHTETNVKQKNMAVSTIYQLRDAGKNYSVRLMMHSAEANFNECQQLAEQFDRDGINYSKKTIGAAVNVTNQWSEGNSSVHLYSKSQTEHLLKFWKKSDIDLNNIVTIDNQYVVASAGFPCCSEKNLCVNGDRKNPVKHISRTDFKGWKCSVNWYFLFVRQYDNTIYHNKSCQATTKGTVGPIGTIDQADLIINEFKQQIDQKAVPVITCPKDICGCGICAPKAKSQDDFKKMIKIHLDESILVY